MAHPAGHWSSLVSRDRVTRVSSGKSLRRVMVNRSLEYCFSSYIGHRVLGATGLFRLYNIKNRNNYNFYIPK